MDILDKVDGRSSELAVLAAQLDRSIAGSPQLVCVEGDRGSGKSSLIAHFARDQAWKRRRIRAILLRPATGTSYDAIDRAALEVRGRVAGLASRGLVLDWIAALPVIGDVLAAIAATAAALRRHRISAPDAQRLPPSVSTLLAAARRRPLVLLIDDAQLLSDRDRRALELLMRRAPSGCALLVVAAFAPSTSGFRAGPQLSEILGDRCSVLTLKRGGAAEDDLPEPLRSWIRSAAGMGPLFDSLSLAALLGRQELEVEDQLAVAVRRGVLSIEGETSHASGETATLYRFVAGVSGSPPALDTA
jgi:hypothetical protein